ncbi:uncharacterized protein [Nicotiana tomentosiformis]|uniref:uncharacterized protein n=1 Tax=Nicotiana tomentosiformis TaxID=4098 RepID=UPI00388CB651
MAGNGEDNVDLAAREVSQQREQAARDAEKAAIKDAQIIYEEERDRLSSVRPPPIAANNFELKKGVLKGIPFTLKDDAKQWLRNLPVGSITTWEEMTRKILYKYFSSTKTGKFRREIDNFCQKYTETIFEAWERFKETVQLDAMAKEIRKMTLATIQNEHHAACDICGRGHPTQECQASTEEVNVVGNYNFNAIRQRHTGFHVVHQETEERLDAHREAIKELGTGLRNLKRQVEHIAIILSERVSGTLPADTEKNPKETVNVNDVDKKKKIPMRTEKKKKEEKSRREEPEKSEHMPALPFPQKLCREKLDKQFLRFLNVLKQVRVNFSFTEVLSQMPAYAKYLKEILTKKRKIEETLVVKLTEHCSAILQNKLLQKCGDPGSFTIPYSVETIHFNKSLCDYGASINLMPLSFCRKLEKEIGEIRSVPISLQLADQMTLIPEGIVEDVLVRVDKFVFSVDFIVVNMEENKEVPLILGRPFLATGKAILDVHDRKLMLRVGEEMVTFDINVEKGAQKEKPATSVEWKVKGSKEKVALSEKDKCGVYSKKAEKRLSPWICALVRKQGMEPNFDSDPE